MAHDALGKQLDELATDVERVGETWWSAWARQIAARIDESSAGSRDVREALVAMGSLHDLIIHSANGHRVGEGTTDMANARLRTLRTRLYELAELERDAP